ncbi:hypothetical protein ACNQR7_02535 [Mycolicibacterium senegalense]
MEMELAGMKAEVFTPTITVINLDGTTKSSADEVEVADAAEE